MMRTIDSDTHFFETVSLWSEYIEPQFRDRVPRLVERGRRLLLDVDGVVYPTSPTHSGLASLYHPDGRPTDAVSANQRLSIDGPARLARMDRIGTFVEVIYPTLGMMGHSAIGDPRLAAAHARAYNRFAADFCSADPQRLRAAMIAPLNHPSTAAEEITFAHSLGLGVLLASFTAPGDRSSSDPALDIVWETCADLGITVTFQDSSLAAGPGTTGIGRATTWRLLYLSAHVIEAQLGIADVILGGVVERFPRLRIGMQETHLTWIPSWLKLLDERFGKRQPLTMLPSEYFRRQCFACAFPDEPGVDDYVDAVGVGNLVFASDWPHRGLMPGADEDWAVEVMRRRDLTADEAVAGLWANPQRWLMS